MDRRLYDGLLYSIPAVIIFTICLFTTLKCKWPLSWDIFYHIHLARIYMDEGFTFSDPICNAPTGDLINYPPLFHLILASLSLISKSDLFKVSRFIQPFLASLIIFSVTFTASGLYDRLTGLCAGLLIISGFIATRIILPLPENLALIFLPISICFYYESIKKSELKFAGFSGILMGLVALTHPPATLCLMLSVTFITVAIVIMETYKEKIPYRVLISYGIFSLIGLSIASIWWLPLIYLSLGVPGGIATSLPFSTKMSILNYPKALGYLTVGLSIIGLISAYRRFKLGDLFVISWIIAMLILSKAYYFGVNVISYRVLIYILIPLAILGAYGLESIFKSIKKLDKRIAHVFIIFVLLFAVSQGYSNFSSSGVVDFGAVTCYGRVSIAPPTPAELELAKWFKGGADKNRVASFSNYYTGYFVMAYSNQPINSLLQNSTRIPGYDELKKNGVGYLVYDKRLKMDDNVTFKVCGNLLYYNPSRINLGNLGYHYLRKVHENDEFIVYMVS